MKFLVLLLILILSNECFSEPLSVMDGIDVKKYIEFHQKWKLVTARFRKDTNEMRFTYANDKAYKTLESGSINYPDGAMFGKVGVSTGEDPLFSSSVAPNGVRRFQVMVKDSKKYAQNHGWGYALFDERGYLFPEDPKLQVVACAACHDAAASRGYVFSQILDIHQHNGNYKKVEIGKNEVKDLIFMTVEVSTLPEAVVKILPKDIKFARLYQVNFHGSEFMGMLDELRPTLALEAHHSKYPALFLGKMKMRYSITFIEDFQTFCEEGGKKGYFMKNVLIDLEGNKKNEIHFCHTL